MTITEAINIYLAMSPSEQDRANDLIARLCSETYPATNDAVVKAIMAMRGVAS